MQMEVERRPFYRPEEILKEVKEKLETAENMRKAVDYITFVPDGEPSLDVNLGQEMDLLKPLGIKVAVISNASLIWDEVVREELSKADWVSLKVDTVDELAWRRINRPHRALRLESILEGILDFSRNYKGVLATETHAG